MFENLIKNKIKDFLSKISVKSLTLAGYKSISIVMEIRPPNISKVEPRLILKTSDDKIINIDGYDEIFKTIEKITKYFY